MKRFTALFMVLIVTLLSTVSYAAFTDIPKNAVYADAVERLNALSIMEGSDKSTFKPQENITREQFTIIVVKAAGLSDTAEAVRGSTVFSDVSPQSEASGYITVALDKGFVSGMADGKFHPKDKITYAEVCTAVIKALGYGDQDVTGLWPKNYIEKAAKLGLTEGITLKSSDGVPKWAMALVIDRLLDTNVKKASASEADKSFADASGLFSQNIILANSQTSARLASNQVQTDKGIFYVKDSRMELKLGNAYRLDMAGDTVKAAYSCMKAVEEISVDNIVGTKITYRVDGETVHKLLPEKTVYYYQGVKQSYDNLKSIIQTRSSIVFTLNKEKSGYEYAVIFDPVYSKPEVARGYDPSTKRIGEIDLSDNPTVVRDGELSDMLQIQEKDVVCRVSDIWGKYGYILATDSRVGGKITAILPDKLSPKTLQIDGVDYAFSDSMEFNKLNYTPGSFNVDDIIVALLGYDGKIIDLDYPGSESNSDYALVLNTSSKVSANSNATVTFTYYAKLLTAEGLTITYEVGADAAQYRGKLVRFSKVDHQRAKLEQIPYDFPKGLSINKKDRYVGANYAADNIKIFNIISDESGVDVQASLLDFDQLPDGEIADGKVYFMNRAGAFDDANVLLTNDILEQSYKTAVVKSMNVSKNSKGIYSYNYTLLIEGKDYPYSEAYINDGDIGSVVKVKMSLGAISSIVDNKSRSAEITATSVQAFDSKRIKLSDKVLWFGKGISVYFLDYAGNLTIKGVADLSANVMYGTVSVYLDKAVDNGGKVQAIVVKQ